ncbi:hypothetical protein ANCCAN_22485 [Ancylostoma caninum]|uniref:Uncharacterized protein n=1 Tax=Ancylostoma caninum TaxID=29170 RepID=A0A368FL44_ANCCA|nr:hypothetical protein ANCCAN_22485 [Ancylostoma caninum]
MRKIVDADSMNWQGRNLDLCSLFTPLKQMSLYSRPPSEMDRKLQCFFLRTNGPNIGESATGAIEIAEDSVVESQPSADEDSVDAGCFEGEEPTEEEGDDSGSREGTNHEQLGENSDKGAETNSEEISPCSACGSTEEPQFVHYKKVQKITGLTGGTFIWRYRCGQKDCAQFFGDFYAYDKISNSFVRVSEGLQIRTY